MVLISGSSLNHKFFPDRSIAVLGSKGQLGRSLLRAFGDAAVGFDRNRCDFLRPESVDAAVSSHAFEWVINAVAYTNVDGAELEIDLCYEVNQAAVARLAAACQRVGSKLLHVSTDYVFGGDQTRRVPYTELDLPSPQSVYAKSKLAGESEAMSCDQHLIVRTCGLYDIPSPDGLVKNFCNTIVSAAAKRKELSIVNDQWCCPTYVPHLVDAIHLLMQRNATGIVHVVNEGPTTWYQFGARLLQLAGIDRVVHPVGSSEYGSVATRPTYSALDTSKFRVVTNSCMPTWEDGLAAYVEQRADLVLKPTH